MFINNPDESKYSMYEVTTHFGGSSQTESQFISARFAIVNDPNTNEVIKICSYYKYDLPVFEIIDKTKNLRMLL